MDYTLSYNGGETLTVSPDASSSRERKLMEPGVVTLKFDLGRHVAFDHVDARYRPRLRWPLTEEEYSLRERCKVTKSGPDRWSYELRMTDAMGALGDWLMVNSVDGRVDWSICCLPAQLCEELAANLNREGRGGPGSWAVRLEGVEDAQFEPTMVEFGGVSLLAALGKICEAFGLEWEHETIGGVETILLGEAASGVAPLEVSMGMGSGVAPGLSLAADSENPPLARLYARGGTENLRHADGSAYDTYGPNGEPCTRLHLPKGATVERGGRVYRTDAGGQYLERAEPCGSTREELLDLGDLCPVLERTVAGSPRRVAGTDTAAAHWEVWLSSGINWGAVRTDEQATVIFQTGMLAGRELKVMNGSTNGTAWLLEEEVDGVTMPGGAFAPRSGDVLRVFHVLMPSASVREAERKLLDAAVDVMEQRSQETATYTLKVDGVWSRKSGSGLERARPGARLALTDPHLAPDGVAIRVTGVKEWLDDPESPTLTLSNTGADGGSLAALRAQLAAAKAEIDRQAGMQRELSRTLSGVAEALRRQGQRSMGDALETQRLLREEVKSLGLGYTDSIKPVTVHSMQMLVGDPSLQWEWEAVGGERFSTAIYYTEADHTLRWDVEAYLRHEAMDAKGQSTAEQYQTMTCERTANASPRYPVLSKGEQDVAANELVYIYVEVDKYSYGDGIKRPAPPAPPDPRNGRIVASVTPMQSDSDYSSSYGRYYHRFLYGWLQPASADGRRALVELHGFTEMLPGRITTGRIQSANQGCSLDLRTGVLNLTSPDQSNLLIRPENGALPTKVFENSSSQQKGAAQDFAIKGSKFKVDGLPHNDKGGSGLRTLLSSAGTIDVDLYGVKLKERSFTTVSKSATAWVRIYPGTGPRTRNVEGTDYNENIDLGSANGVGYNYTVEKGYVQINVLTTDNPGRVSFSSDSTESSIWCYFEAAPGYSGSHGNGKHISFAASITRINMGSPTFALKEGYSDNNTLYLRVVCGVTETKTIAKNGAFQVNGLSLGSDLLHQLKLECGGDPSVSVVSGSTSLEVRDTGITLRSGDSRISIANGCLTLCSGQYYFALNSGSNYSHWGVAPGHTAKYFVTERGGHGVLSAYQSDLSPNGTSSPTRTGGGSDGGLRGLRGDCRRKWLRDRGEGITA